MRRILNLSLGSSKRNFEVCFKIKNYEIVIARVGCDGDTKAFKERARKARGYDAVAIGGINAYYSFDVYVWPLKQYQELTSDIKLPLYDGWWIKSLYEPYSLKRIFLEEDSLNYKSWLVFSVLDRYPCYEYLNKNGIDVKIGDPYAGLNIPLFLNGGLFKAAALIMMPIFARFPVHRFYPHSEKQNEYNNKFLSQFDVILTETNFFKYKNYTNLAGKTLILSRSNQEDREFFSNKGVQDIHTLLPGEILSANIIEAMVGVSIGFNNDIEKTFKLIDNIERIK